MQRDKDLLGSEHVFFERSINANPETIAAAEIKQVTIIRADLSMNVGTMVVQGEHGAVKAAIMAYGTMIDANRGLEYSVPSDARERVGAMFSRKFLPLISFQMPRAIASASSSLRAAKLLKKLSGSISLASRRFSNPRSNSNFVMSLTLSSCLAVLRLSSPS